MTLCRPVPLLFSREEIAAGLFTTHVRWLDALLDPPAAQRHRQRLVLGFTGFNGAALYEHPRVRQWMADLDAHWPYWFFFLDPSTSRSLWALMLLLCPLERNGLEVEIDSAAYRHFLDRHFAAMDAVCALVGDDELTRQHMKEAVRHALL